MAPRKRAAPEPEATTAPSSRRRSGRVASTPKKSAYFESDPESELDEPPAKKRGRPSLNKKKKEPSPEDDSDGYAEEDAVKEDEEEDGQDDEDDDEEDVPRKVTIVPLEQMRDTGGVEYDNSRIHKNSLLFLKDLKAHNQRPWLKAHDGEYRRAFKDWWSFVEATTATIIDVDDTIPELPVKDVVFRIYRDTRFSKDPTPYKPHFSAAWSRTGRKGPYAVYYIHLEPGSSFIGGGLWCPPGDQIAKVRESIDERPRRWRRVLGDETFRQTFMPDVKGGAEDAVQAFVQRNQNNALKKRPMGYDQDHRDIALLKLKNYTIGAKIDDGMLCRDEAQERVREIIAAMSGFISFLNSVVMPDPTLNDDESEEEDSGEQEDDADKDEE